PFPTRRSSDLRAVLRVADPASRRPYRRLSRTTHAVSPPFKGVSAPMTSATAPTINVRVTAVLQKITEGKKTVEASGSTVAEVFEDIDAKYPGFKAQVYGPDGKLHRFVNIYLNDEDIRYTGGV